AIARARQRASVGLTAAGLEPGLVATRGVDRPEASLARPDTPRFGRTGIGGRTDRRGVSGPAGSWGASRPLGNADPRTCPMKGRADSGGAFRSSLASSRAGSLRSPRVHAGGASRSGRRRPRGGSSDLRARVHSPFERAGGPPIGRERRAVEAG